MSVAQTPRPARRRSARRRQTIEARLRRQTGSAEIAGRLRDIPLSADPCESGSAA